MGLLPVIQHPTFHLTLPSTQQKINYRPFLVKEEKILLIAQSSGDQSDIVKAVKQVVSNCIVDKDIDVNNFTTYDLEYFFIKLRAKSVQNIISLTYRDNEDDQLYDVEVNLDNVEVMVPEVVSNVVVVDEGSSLKLRHPKVSLIDDAGEIANGVDFNFFIIQSCIDKIILNNEEHDPSEYSTENLAEYIENLPVPVYQHIQKFIDAMPRVEHVISYTNSNGKKVEITLKTLTDFFMLG